MMGLHSVHTCSMFTDTELTCFCGCFVLSAVVPANTSSILSSQTRLLQPCAAAFTDSVVCGGREGRCH